MKQDKAFAAAYAELKALANVQMSKERASHTLTPTALVHDAYIRLAQGGDVSYRDEQHFFRLAANVMRRLLIDHARTKGRAKRGGAFKRLGIDEVDIAAKAKVTEFDTDDLVALAEALEKLETDDPQLARIVELRYYSPGATMKEIAEELKVSERTVYNDWNIARGKLRAILPE
jgi:RNA polymerase sigma-70 factor (ECF subfamily)